MPLSLNENERPTVVPLLEMHVFSTSEVIPLLQSIVGKGLANRIPQQATVSAWATVVLAECEREDWQEDGSHVLIKLLRYVRAADPRVMEIVRRLQATPPPPNPVHARLLDNRQAFLERHSLRATMPDLMNEKGPCVLRVNGKSRSGKSYTHKFLMFLSLEKRNLHPLLVKCTGVAHKATAVAQTLVGAMGGNVNSMPDISSETPLRTGQILAEWVLTVALQKPDKYWFVLDNFGDVNLPEATQEFVRQLPLLISSGWGRDRYRVVLLNYEADLPDELRRLQKKEALDPVAVNWRPEVEDYFSRLIPALPANTQTSDVEEAIEEVLARIQNAPADQLMQKLCEAVEEATDELLAS